MKSFKSNKAITLTVLVITITIILILTTVIITSTYAGIDLRRYKSMCSDVEILEDKILYFYREYGELPVGNQIDNVPTDIENGHTFYEVNTSKLKNVTLNYGDDDDIYIVDADTFEVYYLNGVEYKNVIYYTD